MLDDTCTRRIVSTFKNNPTVRKAINKRTINNIKIKQNHKAQKLTTPPSTPQIIINAKMKSNVLVKTNKIK